MGRRPKILEPHRQAKGDGNLTLRKGIWYMRLVVDGKQLTKSTHLREADKVQAYKMLEDFVRPFKAKSKIEQYQNLQAKINVVEYSLSDDEKKRRKVKWDEKIDVYFKRGFSQDISERTRESYEFIIKRLDDWTKKQHKNFAFIDDFTISDAEEYNAQMASTLSPRSYNTNIHFLKWLWKCLNAGTVWDKFKDKQVGESNRKAFSVEQLNAIFSYLESKKNDGSNGELLLLIKLGMYTGMRLGDCCHLRFDEIDMQTLTISKTPHKTKRFNTKVVLPIHQSLVHSLEDAFMNRKDDEYVIPFMKHQYECGSLTTRLREMFNKCGISTCERDGNKFKSVYCFHSFRHTFVSMCANNNMPQNEVMKLVGHTTGKMTAKYYHADLSLARQYLSYLPKIGNEEKDVAPKVDVQLDKDIYDYIMRNGHDVNAYLRKQLLENIVEIG